MKAQRIAFVCPRFAEGPLVGGAETLLRNLALRAAGAGRDVTFLTTCATDHFTWRNELPAGRREVDGMQVRFFPVDENRDLAVFLSLQRAISAGAALSREEEEAWLDNSVNSTALYDHLRSRGNDYDRIVAGPYLFALVRRAALVSPDKTLLVPCLHDEAFARLDCFRRLFRRVHGFMFNTVPERDLAWTLYDLARPDPGRAGPFSSVVGMGIDPFEADPAAFAARYRIGDPYVIYSGRREPLKGTPLLIDYLTAFRSRTRRAIKLVLTGSGQIDLSPEIKPHVLDAGFLPEAGKREAMAGAVAFCHPSVHESLGIVVLESWLARTPALVHAGGAVLRYQCEQSNGGLWFRTYPEFEEELLMLLEDRPLRDRLAEMGRRYVVDAYGWDRIEPRLLSALDHSPLP